MILRPCCCVLTKQLRWVNNQTDCMLKSYDWAALGRQDLLSITEKE